MVMGHTPHRKIQSNCDGSVLVIDTGISKAYGGILSALEIKTYILEKDNQHYYKEVLNALYEDEIVNLSDELIAL